MAMTFAQFDAVIVGAGFAGIGAAIQLKRLGIDDFVILDREDDLGGTWYVNHYPGLAVDVPTTTYSYFFEPNPNWSRLFTPGPEIKQYADDVADKYGVREHMRFNTTVEGARWDEESKVWRIALAGGETLAARYLITATGFLSQPKVPEIAGIDDFAGKVVHTTEWEDDFDAAGRRIAVIGTGATAVQLIPELAKKAADLTVYQRTPIWVVPKIDVRFGERTKRLFARIPLTQRVLRWLTDSIYEVMVSVGVRHYRTFRGRFNISASDLSKMHRFAVIRDADLRRRLTPRESVCVPRTELLQHHGISDAADGPAVLRGEASRRNDVRGHRAGQRGLPGPDDPTARGLAVHHGQLWERPLVLLQPAGRTDVAAAVVDRDRDQGSVGVSAE